MTIGSLPLKDLHLEALLPHLWRLLREHGLYFDTHLVWLFKAMANGEDIARRLQADFNMIEYARPYYEKVIRQSFNPLSQFREILLSALDLIELVKELPYELKRLARQFSEGKVKIDFELMGLEPVRKTLSQASKRLALSIILAALIIGSSLIVLSGLPPLVAGYILSPYLPWA